MIAHRGFSSRAPENTIPAFELAVESGFPNFELDAQLSSDGAAVVIHDETLERTTGGSGLVATHTLAELQSLDAGARFTGERPKGQVRIPTLEDVLQRFHGRAHIHLELKSGEETLAHAVAELLLRHGWLGFATAEPFESPGITVTSFALEQLERSRELVPEIRHSWLISKIDPSVMDQARAARIQGLCPQAATADADSIGLARDVGFVVRGWGVRNESDLKNLFQTGAQGTTVDWPDRARAYLRSLP